MRTAGRTFALAVVLASFAMPGAATPQDAPPGSRRSGSHRRDGDIGPMAGGGGHNFPMAGTYAVGAGRDLPTPTAAASALTTRGQIGPVTFDVYAGTYMETLTLGAVGGNSCANTITFRKAPDAGGAVDLGPVQITGASYVTLQDFDSITGAAGSKAVSVGGASTDISLVHSRINASGNWGAGVYVGPGGGHDNVSISRCEIVGSNNAFYAIQIDDNDNPSPGTTGLSLTNNMVRGFVVRAIDLWSNFGSLSGVAYHNTVWITAPWNCYAVRQAVWMGGLVWRNNIFANHSPSGGSTCFTHTGGTLDSDYNDFYRPNGAVTGFVSGNFRVTLADWQAATGGEDAHSIQADPLFVAAENLHLQAGSPCIDTGTNVDVATDYDGDARPAGSAPDMGADERVSLTPAERIGAVKNMVRHAFESGAITKEGTATSLGVKLDAAYESIQNGNAGAAANQLEALTHELEAQAWKSINPSLAYALTEEIGVILTGLAQQAPPMLTTTLSAGGRINHWGGYDFSTGGDSAAAVATSSVLEAFYYSEFRNVMTFDELKQARKTWPLATNEEKGNASVDWLVFTVTTEFEVAYLDNKDNLKFTKPYAISPPTRPPFKVSLTEYGARKTKRYGYRWVLGQTLHSFILRDGASGLPWGLKVSVTGEFYDNSWISSLDVPVTFFTESIDPNR